MSKENAIRKINLVGEWLLDLLEQENISQRRLSALSGVGVATINRSIKGVVVPNRSTVQSLLFTLFGRDYERIERELEIYDYLKKRQKNDKGERKMKKLLLILVMILSVLTMSACQTRQEPIDLNAYDYYLMVVVSRQRQSQDTFVYVLKDTRAPETTDDTITYETDKIWTVGEFVIAIELDEEGNVYFTDLHTTTDMIVNQYQKK